MPTIHFQWTGNGIARINAALDTLKSSRHHAAMRRAINHTGDRTFTIVKRTLSKQIGAPQRVIVQYGKVRTVRAGGGSLDYLIIARGGPIPLKHFRARQTRKGVTASPWNNRKTYKSAFIVNSLGGHAFWREGKSRLPIKRIAGPNVPKEMVKDEVAAAFQSTVASFLAPRVEHEVRVITKGVLS